MRDLGQILNNYKNIDIPMQPFINHTQISFNVEVKQSVKFTLFSKVISTLIKKLLEQGCRHLVVPPRVTSQGWFATMASLVKSRSRMKINGLFTDIITMKWSNFICAHSWPFLNIKFVLRELLLAYANLNQSCCFFIDWYDRPATDKCFTCGCSLT